MLNTLPRRICFALLACPFLLSIAGCGGCDLAPVTINIPFGTAVTIPASPVDVTNLVLPLGADCQFDSVTELLASVNQAAPGVITQFLRIDRLILQEIRFTATNGNFAFLEEMSVTLIVERDGVEQRFTLGATDEAGTFDDVVSLQAPQPFDLWAIFDNDPDCVSGEISISGAAHEAPVTFNGVMTLILYPALNI